MTYNLPGNASQYSLVCFKSPQFDTVGIAVCCVCYDVGSIEMDRFWVSVPFPRPPLCQTSTMICMYQESLSTACTRFIHHIQIYFSKCGKSFFFIFDTSRLLVTLVCSFVDLKWRKEESRLLNHVTYILCGYAMK